MSQREAPSENRFTCPETDNFRQCTRRANTVHFWANIFGHINVLFTGLLIIYKKFTLQVPGAGTNGGRLMVADNWWLILIIYIIYKIKNLHTSLVPIPESLSWNWNVWIGPLPPDTMIGINAGKFTFEPRYYQEYLHLCLYFYKLT